MGNVVDFGSARGTQEVATSNDKAQVFLLEHLIPWAEASGIDTKSQKFQINGATILTCIQGMLLDGI